MTPEEVDAYEEGFSNGHMTGGLEGYEEGMDAGVRIGYADGYNRGWEACYVSVRSILTFPEIGAL